MTTNSETTPIRLVIFDFDGTLADTFSVFAESINNLATLYNFKSVSPDEIKMLRSLGVSEILQILQLPAWRVPKVLSSFRDMLQHRIGEIQTFTGIHTALQTIASQGVCLALATSNSLVNVEAVLGHVLLQRFTTIECGSALFGKARRLHRILQRTHICNENAIYVGDEIRDADAARKIGIRFGAVAWGYTELQALISMQPAAIFKTPADLVNLV